MNRGTVIVALFDGEVLFSVDLDTQFRDVVAMCRETLKDAELTQENFGERGLFFFRCGKSSIVDREFFPPSFTLAKIGFRDARLLELCDVP